MARPRANCKFPGTSGARLGSRVSVWLSRFQGVITTIDGRLDCVQEYPLKKAKMKTERCLGSRCSLLLVLLCLMTACGGGYNNVPNNGPNNGANNVGPTAIITGSSLATATGYWVSANCAVSVELTGDGGFEYAVTDTSGTTSRGYTTWSTSGGSAVINGGDFFWVSSLTNISGSTASGSFTSGVTVTDQTDTSQELGSCSFRLQSGQLCPVSGGTPDC